MARMMICSNSIRFVLVVVMMMMMMTVPTVNAQSKCSVCGVNKVVGKPKVVFSFPGQPKAACSALQTAGNNGKLPSVACTTLPKLALFTKACACKAK
jgi:hypothetical protein